MAVTRSQYFLFQSRATGSLLSESPPSDPQICQAGVIQPTTSGHLPPFRLSHFARVKNRLFENFSRSVSKCVCDKIRTNKCNESTKNQPARKTIMLAVGLIPSAIGASGGGGCSQAHRPRRCCRTPARQVSTWTWTSCVRPCPASSEPGPDPLPCLLACLPPSTQSQSSSEVYPLFRGPASQQTVSSHQ